MITAITFQFKYNKKYLTKSVHKHHAYGDLYTTDLEKHLKEDAALLKKLGEVIGILNEDLAIKNLHQFLKGCFMTDTIHVTQKTKTIRTYMIRGLTIHEDDMIVEFDWDKVEYAGIKYKCRVIPDLNSDDEDKPTLLIAPIELQTAMTIDGIGDQEFIPKDENALSLDEQICYYAQQSELKLSDKDLFHLIYD